MSDGPAPATTAPLIRGIGLSQATALNVNNMIGIGPFLTLPLIVADMGGPQALLCWLVGAVVAVSDGMVWAELSSRMPGSGGTYVCVREAYGPRWGLLMSFLFIWQVSIQGPLSFMGGCIGFSNYLAYLVPALRGPGMKAAAVGVAAVVVFLLYRRITVIGRISSGRPSRRSSRSCSPTRVCSMRRHATAGSSRCLPASTPSPLSARLPARARKRGRRVPLIPLPTVITSLVIIRSIVQFIGQNIGLMLLRRNARTCPCRSACGSTRCRASSRWSAGSSSS